MRFSSCRTENQGGKYVWGEGVRGVIHFGLAMSLFSYRITGGDGWRQIGVMASTKGRMGLGTGGRRGIPELGEDLGVDEVVQGRSMVERGSSLSSEPLGTSIFRTVKEKESISGL